MKLKLFYILIIVFPLSLNAQSIKRAKTIIDSLCAPYMHGRGYTNNGDKIAAEYISKHFTKAKLKKYGNSYLQAFNLNVNTFESQPELIIDGKKLKLGEDFIVKSSSPSGKGALEIYKIDPSIFEDEKAEKKFLKKNLSEKAIVYDLSIEKKIFQNSKQIFKKIANAKLLIATTTKLTHSIASYQLPFPSVVILKDMLPKNIKKIEFEIAADLINGYQTQNLIGYIEGTSKPDSYLVFSAHYDHLGDMGDIYFPGANDNATGVAILLELAYYFSENPSPYSIAFIAFGAEEAGLVGSKFYTENPLFPLSKIKFLTNLDLFATGEQGLTAVNGSVFKEQFELLKKANTSQNYLPEIKSRGKAANSDHYFFTEKGVPSFFFYLMGDWKHYHDVNDKTPVPLSKFKEAFLLIRDFANSF